MAILDIGCSENCHSGNTGALIEIERGTLHLSGYLLKMCPLSFLILFVKLISYTYPWISTIGPHVEVCNFAKRIKLYLWPVCCTYSPLFIYDCLCFFYISTKLQDDLNAFWAYLTFYGGKCQLHLNKKVTHLVVKEARGVSATRAWTYFRIIIYFVFIYITFVSFNFLGPFITKELLFILGQTWPTLRAQLLDKLYCWGLILLLNKYSALS